MIKYTGIITITYSILVLMGGLIGYLFAESLPSLISGTLFGALLFTCGLGILRTNTKAFLGAIVLSAMLAAFFGYRYWMTAKMMPAGMMGLISGLVFLMLLTTRAKRK